MNLETAKKVYEVTNYQDTMGGVSRLEEAGLIEKFSCVRGAEIIDEAKKLYNPLDDAKVGDGATLIGYSQRYAYTIIARTEKVITIQRDKTKLLNGDDLVFHVGGFAAHCSNQNIQEYEYTADPEGLIQKISRRKDGTYRVQKSSEIAVSGRSEFYDYNF